MKLLCLSLVLLLPLGQIRGCRWRGDAETSETRPPRLAGRRPKPSAPKPSATPGKGEEKPPGAATPESTEPSPAQPPPSGTSPAQPPPEGAPKTTPPPSDGNKSKTSPPPSSGEKGGTTARRETVELIRYDARSDIGLANRYLDRLKSLQGRRRYNGMRVYAGKLSQLMAYVEGHLPGVSLQVGLERVGNLLDKGETDKAAREIQRLATELRSLPTIAGSEGSTLASLRDIAESLSDGDDVDTARESLQEIRVSYPSGADPSVLAREIRSLLTSLEIAISREAPQVIQANLETLRSLLTKLDDALSSALPPPQQAQSPTGGTTPPRT